MEFLPTVIEAEYRGEYLIKLTFNDGVEETLDFARWLEGPVFEPLKDVGYFQRFFLEGGTVTWPNGADIAPETLHELAKARQAAIECLAKLLHRLPMVRSGWRRAAAAVAQPACVGGNLSRRREPCLSNF